MVNFNSPSSLVLMMEKEAEVKTEWDVNIRIIPKCNSRPGLT